jgi:hypothetical protein
MKYRNINKIRSPLFKWNEIMSKYLTSSMCIQISATELKLTCILEPGLDIPCDTAIQGKVKLQYSFSQRSTLLCSDGSIARLNFQHSKVVERMWIYSAKM